MDTAIDNLGRKIDANGMNLKDIRSLIGTLMKSKVGEAKPINPQKKENNNLSEIEKLFRQYTKDYAKDIDEQKKLIKEVVDSINSIANSRQERRKTVDKPVAPKEVKATAKNIDSINKTLKKKKSDCICEDWLKKIYEALNSTRGPRGPKTPNPGKGGGGNGGGGGSGGNKGGASPSGGGGGKNSKTGIRTIDGQPVADDLAIMSYFISSITNELAQVEKYLMGFNALEPLFKGLIDKEREFVQQAREIAYETNNATKETEALNRTYEDIGSTVYQTGVDRDTFQKSYTKALKSGIRDLKTASSITKSQLNTEKQLGMEAGTLGDEFKDWTLAGKMSVGQIADMGRGMREVARNTGITGEELNKAVNSSKEMIQSLKNAATLTSTTAKNVIEIQANAQKLGIEGQMQPLMKAMSSSSNLLLEASNETRALLLSAANSTGRINDLMQGTILRSKAGIKDMARGLESQLQRFGVSSFEAIDQLSDQAKADINLRLKATFGVELGELRAAYETLNESGKEISERLADINKKRMQSLTLEEKNALLEEERRIKASKNLEVLTALDEAAKGAKNMDQALEKFGSRRSEFEKDLSALGQSWSSEADVARGAIQNAMDSVNAGLKEAGKDEISIDSSEIERALKDPVAFRELTSKISKGEQELATAQKAQLDPMTDMQHSLQEINDNIRNYVNSGFSMMFNSLIGKIIAMTGAVLGITGGLSLFALGIMQRLDTIKRIFSDDKEKGGQDIVGKVIRRFTGEKDPNEEGLLKTVMGSIKRAFNPQKKDPLSEDQGSLENIVEAVEGQQVTGEKGLDVFKLMLKELEAIHSCVCNDKATIATKNSTVASEKAKQGEVASESGGKVVDNKESVGETKGFDVEKVKEAGKKMIKDAAALAVLGLGILALASGIIFIADKIISTFNIDLGKILKTVAVIGAMALAVVAIVKGSMLASEALASSEVENFVSTAKDNSGKMFKAAGALLIIGPALLAFGGAMIAISSLILSKLKLDLGSVTNTAAIVAEVAGVAGVMAAGIVKFVEEFENLDENKTWKELVDKPGKFLKKLATTSVSLILVGGAIMLLGVAIIKMAQVLTSGVDMSTATDIGHQIAGIIFGTGIIAIAIMAAAKGLDLLGEFSKKISSMMWNMMLGAAAMTLLAPAITLLAVGLVAFISGVTSALGMDISGAAKLANDISGLIMSVGWIALAVMAASGALVLLGWLGTTFIAQAPLLLLGGLALLLLAPGLTALALGVIGLSKMMMGGTDPAETVKIAESVSSILTSAGEIAWAVLGATVALAALGYAMTSGIFWVAAGLALAGAAALLILTPAMIYLAKSIIGMGQGMLAGTDTSKATEIAQGVSSILNSANEIASSIIISAAKLSILGALFPIAVMATGYMYVGVAALNLLMNPLSSYLNTIFAFSKSIGIEPKKAVEMGEGVAAILEAAGKVTDGIMSTKDKLSALSSDWFWVKFFGNGIWGGVEALKQLEAPVVEYLNTIVKISKRLGSTLDPKQAASMAEGVAEILVATGKVTDGIMSTKDKLEGLSPNWLWMPFLAKNLMGGIIALKALEMPLKMYLNAVVSIARNLGSGLDPKQAASMAKGVAQILNACGEVTNEIMKTRDNLMSIKSSKGFWIFSKDIVESMNEGVNTLKAMHYPILKYINQIVFMARSMAGQVNPKSAKSLTKSLISVSEIVSLFSSILNQVSEKIVPLTEEGWFTSSPVQKMMDAKSQMETFFPAMVDLLNTIVVSANVTLASTKQLKTATKNLNAMAMVLNAALPSIKIMNESIAPLAEDGLFGDSDLTKLNESIPKFNGFFNTISNFVNTIVFASQNIQGVDKLKESAKKMVYTSSLLKHTNEAIGSLSSVTDMMSDGFFTKSPISKIIQNKDAFKIYFLSIGKFVEEGIVNPINNVIPDGAEIKKASSTLCLLSRLLCGTKSTLESLAGVMGLMDAKSFFEASPMSKIIQSKDLFSRWFNAIAGFIKDGIVKPVLSTFPDPKLLSTASGIMCGMAIVSRNIAPIINYLSQAIALATDSDFYDVAPVPKIVANIKIFSKWFKEIARFLKKGIIEPVKKEMKGINLGAAAKTLESMTNISKNIAPLIKNLSSTMGLMSDPNEKFFDDEFPIDKIMIYKDQFAKWFKDISIFMREGIIKPILNELPDPQTIMMASRILSAMTSIIKSVPQVILGISNGLMALIDSGMRADIETAQDKIDGNTDKFRIWFTKISAFMRDGIVAPILTELPDPQTLMMASRVLSAMNSIITTIPSVIKKLADLVKMFDPAACIEQSPAETLSANSKLFGDWFSSVIGFFQTGILQPIVGLPNASDISASLTNLKSLPKSMKEVVDAVTSVSNDLNMSSSFKTMANSLTNGIIIPSKLLPDTSAIAKIIKDMDQIVIMLNKYQEALLAINSISGSISSNKTDLSGLNSLGSGSLTTNSTTTSVVSNPTSGIESDLIAKQNKIRADREIGLTRLRGPIGPTNNSLSQTGYGLNNVFGKPLGQISSDQGTMNPVAQTAPTTQNIHTNVASEVASTSPSKTEITSSELGQIASESNAQTTQLEELVSLFKQVLSVLEPKSQKITSNSGGSADTSPNEISHKPPNFFRNTVGLVSQTPGKAILNIGPQTG